MVYHQRPQKDRFNNKSDAIQRLHELEDTFVIMLSPGNVWDLQQQQRDCMLFSHRWHDNSVDRTLQGRRSILIPARKKDRAVVACRDILKACPLVLPRAIHPRWLVEETGVVCVVEHQ